LSVVPLKIRNNNCKPGETYQKTPSICKIPTLYRAHFAEDRHQHSRGGLSKYRPVGKRGIAFNVAHDEYQSGEPRTKLDNANSTNILIAMIESKEGIDNVNDIISTKGIDMAWLGHFDLTDSLGVPGNFKNKIFNNCVESFISACNEHKKPAGFLDTNFKMLQKLKNKGFTVLGYGHDVIVFQTSLKNCLNKIMNMN
jgi:2-keto-3-deoxy-L-rhamnonate aldolase RhmA